jgi:hypothetical protein
MGFPYLWGGTSTKGIDYGSFTKTIFFLKWNYNSKMLSTSSPENLIDYRSFEKLIPETFYSSEESYTDFAGESGCM